MNEYSSTLLHCDVRIFSSHQCMSNWFHLWMHAWRESGIHIPVPRLMYLVVSERLEQW